FGLQLDPQREIGRWLLVTGVVLALTGGLLAFGTKLPFRLGRLPGDFVIKRDAFTFYMPLGTTILVSVVLTGVLWLLRRRP
ncbi:MAG TPA: DUF2905 domain-containing protein, partial [Candidatus Krumholzibacteria bacterium]|nr:DUF2905 domain-containing protein [Candidatus Krumholzibacteria bacterium]